MFLLGNGLGGGGGKERYFLCFRDKLLSKMVGKRRVLQKISCQCQGGEELDLMQLAGHPAT